MGARVLVVDDEPDIVALLEYNFGQAGHDVAHAATGAAALAAIQGRRPDVVLLDINLPDVSGKEICRRLRADPQTQSIPIIMITARADEIDRVVGFELGADDYVVKPFSPREVVLRVEAILRRAATVSAPVGPESAISIGVVQIDPGSHEVRVDGRIVELTPIEFKLLHALASRSGRLFTRETLLEDVWGYVPGLETRTVDTHVKRVRAKLGIARDYIETLRGLGYRFRVPPP